MSVEREGGAHPFSDRDSYREMEARITELAEQSKMEKTYEADRELLRSPEGEEFSLRQVSGPEDAALERIHALLAKTFPPEEVDPLESLKANAKEDSVAYHYIENAKGEVVALSQAEYLKVAGLSLKKDGFLFVVYIVTDPQFRQQGFATELYQKMYDFGLEQARKSNERITAVIGETVETVEPFLNRMGRKRVYFEDQKGDVREVPYVLPPLDWDSKTGEPKLDSSSEHLMVKLLDGRHDLTSSELLGMVRAMYATYDFDRDYFASDEAHANQQRQIQRYFGELQSALAEAKEGRLFLMSVEERVEKTHELKARNRHLIENVKEEK